MHSVLVFFFFSSRRRHTRLQGDWSSDVCSSDLFDDARAFVHQRVQQPVEDFLIGDLTALDAKIARYRLDERHHLRVRGARASLVTVEALTRLLTEPSLAHQALRSEERRVGKEGRSR